MKIPPSFDSEQEIDRILSKEGGSIGIDDIMGIETDTPTESIFADLSKEMEDLFDE